MKPLHSDVGRQGRDWGVEHICVFAGSSQGIRAEYGEAARALGRELAARKLTLVYGGSSVGLMGALADSVLSAGGAAIGVLPRGLFKREVAHPGLTELREVGSMHERKALMADLAGGFIALPGGFGTFDELFEIITWAQIGLHRKPIGLLDAHGYFGPLLALVRHATREGFIPDGQLDLLLHETDPARLLERMGHAPAFLPSPWAEPLPER
jgi:uncharacterized protein (TIGR00730 family)